MKSHEPAEIQKENESGYSNAQRVILSLLQWGAWTAVITAIMHVLRAA